MKHNFDQNESVVVNNGSIKCFGIIVGMAIVPLPGSGACYMVQVTDGQYPTSEYPFNTIAAFESQLTRVSDTKD